MELSPHCFFAFDRWWRSWHLHVLQAYCQRVVNKTGEKYEKVQKLIRCKLSFLILRSVLLCIKRSRAISKDSDVLDDFSPMWSAAGLF